jgi:hypothetical protein
MRSPYDEPLASILIHFDVGIPKEVPMQFPDSRSSAPTVHLHYPHTLGTPLRTNRHYPRGKHLPKRKEKFSQLPCRRHHIQIADTYLHIEGLRNGKLYQIADGMAPLSKYWP